MFNQQKFSEILNNIVKKYDSISDFANVSSLGRSYISKYINLKLDSPPSPKILEKISNHSKNVTNYYELMQVCGYIIDEGSVTVHQSLFDKSDDNFYTVPIFINIDGKLKQTTDDVVLPFKWDHIHQYYGYRATDDSMLPLLGVGDLAIIEQTNNYADSKTYLISIDNKDIIIRKIVDFKSYIELHNAFSYGKPIKLTKDDIKKRNFSILGEVIKAEINFR